MECIGEEHKYIIINFDMDKWEEEENQELNIPERKLKVHKCSFCSDTNYILEGTIYIPCYHCNKDADVQEQEVYITDPDIGKYDPEVRQRELEDLGLVDEDTGKSIIDPDFLSYDKSEDDES